MRTSRTFSTSSHHNFRYGQPSLWDYLGLHGARLLFRHKWCFMRNPMKSLLRYSTWIMSINKIAYLNCGNNHETSDFSKRRLVASATGLMVCIPGGISAFFSSLFRRLLETRFSYLRKFQTFSWPLGWFLFVSSSLLLYSGFLYQPPLLYHPN